MSAYTTLDALLDAVADEISWPRDFVVLDLESTGTNPEQDRIVEVTIGRFNVNTLASQVLEMRVNPGVPIPAEASAVHGILDAHVAALPAFSAIAARVSALLAGADLIGFHHRRFDVRLLVAELQRCGLLNPIADARMIDVGQIFMTREPRTLEAAMRFFCDEAHEGAHGTTADVVATLKVFLAQLQRYDDLPRTVEGLDAIGRDPSWIDREGKLAWKGGQACLNFGAHAGTPLRSVKTEYLTWIVGRDFPSDTKAIVRAALRGVYPTPPTQTVGAGS